MSRIFLSHSSKDNFEAIAVRDWLAAEDWNDVFLDVDLRASSVTIPAKAHAMISDEPASRTQDRS